MKEKLQRFMSGRYGIDSYNKFLLGTAIAICVINMITRWEFLSLLTTALLVYVYFRMLSRNHGVRSQENTSFLGIKNKVTGKFHVHKNRMEDRKTNHIYSCPTCKQKIRVPKGKGRICITCPKCKTKFERKS